MVQVLGPTADQADVYAAAVEGLVEDVLNGYNATIMAYGPTGIKLLIKSVHLATGGCLTMSSMEIKGEAGAGKTYTLSSIHADAIGIVPRAGMEIFQRSAVDKLHDYTISLSYIQVYQETIQVMPAIDPFLCSQMKDFQRVL